MSCTLFNCGYDQTGHTNYQQINPLDPLKQHGAHDISSLVYRMVTQDLGYTGSNKYTLTLKYTEKNTEMVLSIWDNPYGTEKHVFVKVELQNGHWVKAGGTPLADSKETSKRLADTLDRISKAAQGVIAPATSGATIGAQSEIQHRLDELNHRMTVASNSLGTPHSRTQMEQLQKLIDPLHDQVLTLAKEVQDLKQQNLHLRGIQTALDKLSVDVPAELHEITASIDALRQLFHKPKSNSDAAQEQRLLEMQRELEKSKQLIPSLTDSVSKLEQEKATLSKEVERLKSNDTQTNDRILSANERLYAQVQEFQHVNNALEAKLEKAIRDQQVATGQVEQLTSTLEQFQIALKAAKDATIQAQKQKEHALAEAAERKREVEQVQQQASDNSLEAARVRCELEQQYDELAKTSNALEAALEAQIAQLNLKLAQSRTNEARIEALTKQLHAAEEARRAAEDKALLYERLNTQLQESSNSSGSTQSLSDSPEEIGTPNSDQSSIDWNGLNRRLQKMMGSKVPFTSVGPILVNLAYLGEMPENQDSWIKRLFEGITDDQVASKKTTITNYYDSKKLTYEETNINKIFGDLQIDVQAVKEKIIKINDPKTNLETSLNLVKDLIVLKNHLQLVVQQFNDKVISSKEYKDRKNLMDTRKAEAVALLNKFEKEIEKIKITLNKTRKII